MGASQTKGEEHMTDLRKAAEMALEALEEINKLSVGEKAICLPAEIDDAMEALRQALAQPEQEPVVGMFEEKLPDQNPPPWVRDYKPKREWVGLTAPEVHECYDLNPARFASRIEAKLKEKNT